jgi:hypothetical protein
MNHMSERDILIRALRASGSEREAQLAEAILPAAAEPAAADPTPPAAGTAPAPAEGEQLPDGILSKDELAAMTMKDANRRYEQIAASHDYHEGRR